MKKFPPRTEYAGLDYNKLQEILKNKRKIQKVISVIFAIIGVGSVLYMGLLGWTMFFDFEMSWTITKLFGIFHLLLGLSFILTSAFNSIEHWEGFILNIILCILCGFDNTFFLILAIPILIAMIYAKNIHLDLLTLMSMKDYPFTQVDKKIAEIGLAYVDRKAYMGIADTPEDLDNNIYYDKKNLEKAVANDVPMDEVDLNAYNQGNFSKNNNNIDYMQSTDEEFKQSDFSGGLGSPSEMQASEENYKDF